MTKSKKIVKRLIIAVVAVILILAIAVGLFFLIYKPTVSFDAADLTGDVTTGASGYLYGVAEDGVPSYNMVESLDISTAATKTANGLQHPIADVNNVADEYIAGGNCDYIVVYLQDMYSTWYYDHENINEMKKNGTYDWKEYIENTYFPMIKDTIDTISSSDYSDKIVYCLYNECDNGVWFGKWVDDDSNEDGGYSTFNKSGRKNFYEAWKLTYDYVKSLDEDALIGGPGYASFSSSNISEFLKYTTKNSCTPDIMIYHELNGRSIYDWQYNVEEMKEIESKYEISTDTPIIISEYGTMEENGNPNAMAKYITQIEYSKVYADQAYWLLANNLCNTAADYNTPNSAWWVYRWYGDMEGQTMSSKISDILHSDLGKALKGKRGLRYKQFMGLGTLTDEKDSVDLLIAGADYNGVIKVKNLQDTELFGKKVEVKISRVTFEGISGQVYEPETVETYITKCSDTLKIKLSDMDSNSAYHIEINIADDNSIEYENDNLQQRFEFEDGTLLGNSYTYDSAYATTGETAGMVGGIEQEGDGVELQFDVPQSGEYALKIIYGNSNDGETADDRVDSVVNLSVDGNESTLSLPNTIKSEITSSIVLTYELEKGNHTLTITHNTGTTVYDSLLVKEIENDSLIYVMSDSDRTTDGITSYLAVAPSDGYYNIYSEPNVTAAVDDAEFVTDDDGNACIYLRRGLNYIDIQADDVTLSAEKSEESADVFVLDASEAELSGDAVLNNGSELNYISGITSESGKAEFVVDVNKGGIYKLTITYSNNEENGVHDYNVDVVEEYITLNINGQTQELYCRNTSSWDTFTTVTTNIELNEGENIIKLSNDGSVTFNDGITSAPHIASLSINEPYKK